MLIASEMLPGWVDLSNECLQSSYRCHSHDHHYIYIYPMLERHGFKGTFAFITEAYDLGIESGRTWRIQEMYAAGAGGVPCEVHSWRRVAKIVVLR